MKTFAIAVILMFQVPVVPRIERGEVTGRIQSSDGHSVAGIRVFAIPANTGSPSANPSTLAAFGETNSAGAFRLENLPRGAYYVVAGLLDAPTYYPGVTKSSDAKAVVIASGERKGSLDFAIDASTEDMLAEIRQVPGNPGAIPSTGRALTAGTKLARRQVLQVEWKGTWWAARIVDLLADGQVRIHYLGWDSTSDETVPISRLQLDEEAVAKTQRAAQDFSELTRSSALSVEAPRIEVDSVPRNPGSILSTGKAVTGKTRLELNQVLQVKWQETWWAARVVDLLADGRVRIHYIGWNSSWDEVVSILRLQLDDAAIEKARQASDRDVR